MRNESHASHDEEEEDRQTEAESFKFLLKPLWDMWHGSVPPGQHPVKMQGAKFKKITIKM